MTNIKRHPRPRLGRLAAAIVAAAAALPAVASAQGSGPVGVWLDHTGRGAIEVLECGKELCGRIVWLKDPNDKSGRPLVDVQNPDRAKRGSPICGLQIIGSLKKQRDGSWDNGWIYDPEEGERFDLEMKLLAPEKLQITGYKGVKFLSETYQWKRLPQTPGPRCAA